MAKWASWVKWVMACLRISGCKFQFSCSYINISTYRSSSGRSYVKLPVKLRSSKKGLINIKNNNQKCSLGFHVKDSNPVKINPERVPQEDKKLANDLNIQWICCL